MRLLLRLASITFVCTSLCISGKQLGPAQTSTTTKSIAPKSSKTHEKAPAAAATRTFKQLRDDITRLTPEKVINAQGLLTDYFISLVTDNAKKESFSAEITQALLEMGISLHMQFMADNQKALDIIHANKKQVADIIARHYPKPLPQQQPQAKKPAAEPAITTKKSAPKEPIAKPAIKPTAQWLASEGTINIEKLEIEVLNYIFKNQTASEQEILNHFIAQLPTNIPTHTTLSTQIESTIKKLLADEPGQQPAKPAISTPPVRPSLKELEKKPDIITPLPSKPAEKQKPETTSPIKPTTAAQNSPQVIKKKKAWPLWLNPGTKKLDSENLKDKIFSLVANNTDITNDEILEKLIQELPDELLNTLIPVQLKMFIAEFFE